MGHGDKYCPRIVQGWDPRTEKPYGPELRAGNRRNIPSTVNRWLAPETKVERRSWVAPGRDDNPAWKGKSSNSGQDDSLTIQVNDQGAWNKLWGSKLPPKVVNFVWRCARSILPTVVALASRGVDVNMFCPLCNGSPETLKHLFLECPEVIDVWRDVIDLTQHINTSFEDWLSNIFMLNDATKMKRSVAVCWNVWKRRNDWVWNRKIWSAEHLKRMVDDCLLEWDNPSLEICRLNQCETSTIRPRKMEDPSETSILE
nr:putative ribonuclease H protein [Ipomoea batatas]